MIVHHHATHLDAAKVRFAHIRSVVDREFPTIGRFVKTHKTEAYKAVLKASSLVDETIVSACIAECRKGFAGQPAQVYPMLHLPGDTNEAGTWHRDGTSFTRNVFWLPLTAYTYAGISYVAGTEGIVSPFSSTILSRLHNIGPLETQIKVDTKSYYSWAPRLTHRGNLNVSDDLSAAIVIFMDSEATEPRTKPLHTFTDAELAAQTEGIKAALCFDGNGNVAKFDSKALAGLPVEFVETFHEFFSLRTKLDLRSGCVAQ